MKNMYKVISISYETGELIEELEGHDVVFVLHHNVERRTARVLVRVDDPLDDFDPERSLELAEGYASVAYRESDDDIPETNPTCAGKNGECSRPVDAEGDRCWQHEEDNGGDD